MILGTGLVGRCRDENSPSDMVLGDMGAQNHIQILSRSSITLFSSFFESFHRKYLLIALRALAGRRKVNIGAWCFVCLSFLPIMIAVGLRPGRYRLPKNCG